MNFPTTEAIAVTNITRHPLLQQAYDVCQAIERCGASVPLTNAVTKASNLLADLDKFIPATPISPGMSFGMAIQALKDGDRVARPGWNDKGMWLSLAGVASPWRASIEGIRQMPDNWQGYSPFIAMYTADGMLVPWLASQTDMLADDWQLVE